MAATGELYGADSWATAAVSQMRHCPNAGSVS